MRLSPALVAGAFALQTSAFLVPLEISKAAEEVSAKLSGLYTTGGIPVNVPCHGCPFASEKDAGWQDGVENVIHLNIDGDLEKGLLINGLPAVPSDTEDFTQRRLWARQIEVETGAISAPFHIGYVLERIYTEVLEEPDEKIVAYLLTINSIGNLQVKTDTIRIALIETPDSLTPVNIKNIPFEATPGATSCDTDSRWSFCRLRAMIKDHIERIIASGRAHGQAAKGWMKGGCPKIRGGHGKFGHFGQDGTYNGRGRHGHHEHEKDHHHHHGHHHKGHHHFRAHRIGKMLHQALRFFIIPALLGVIGGLMASAVGMLVGQLIVYMWIRFRRNNQRGPLNNNTRVVEIVVAEDEKHALMGEEPEEAVPAYQDVEAVVVEKK